MTRLLMAFALVLGLTDLVSADEPLTAKDLFMRGSKAYDLGLYNDAIHDYMEAYKLKDDPALLYNIAQAHRLADRPVDAVRFYRRYLARTPDATNRAEVQARIVELDKLIEQRKTQAAPRTPSAPPSEAAPAAEAAAAHPPATDSKPGRSKKIAGIVAMSAGVAALATGVVFGVLAKQAGDNLTTAAKNMVPFDPNKESTGRTYQTVEGVMLGVGAAAAVAGAVVFFLGHRDAARARAAGATAISPLVGPQLAGAAFHATF